MRRIETNFLIYDLAKQGIKKSGPSFVRDIFIIFILNVIFTNFLLLGNSLELNIFYEDSLSLQMIQVFVAIVMFLFGSSVCYTLICPKYFGSLFWRILRKLYQFLWLSFILLSYFNFFVIYSSEVFINKLKMLNFTDINLFLYLFIFTLVTLFYFLRRGFCFKRKELKFTMGLVALNSVLVLELFFNNSFMMTSLLFPLVLFILFIYITISDKH